MLHHRTLKFLLTLAASCVLLGCGSDPNSDTPASGPKFATPQAAFDAFKAAGEKEDWRALASILSPDDQARLASSSVLAASFSTMGDEKKEKEFDALLKKHGIDLDEDPEPEATDPDEAMMALAAPIADKPAFIAEIMKWEKANSDSESKSPMLALKTISNIKTTGDTASGMVETKIGQQPLEFKKIDGSWRICLPQGPPPGATARASDDFTTVDPNEPIAAPAAGPGTHGVFRVADRAYELNHAVAYKSKFFGDDVTKVLLTTKPLSGSAEQQLLTVLREDGSDDAFFHRGVSLSLTFDQSGELVSLFGWADNHSINTDKAVAECRTEDGRAAGTATMDKPNDLFGDETYQFNVRFEAEFLAAN